MPPIKLLFHKGTLDGEFRGDLILDIARAWDIKLVYVNQYHPQDKLLGKLCDPKYNPPEPFAVATIDLENLYDMNAYFENMTYRLRWDLDPYLYNEEYADSIGMKPLQQLISPLSKLAPMLVSPYPYVYAWYCIHKDVMLWRHRYYQTSLTDHQEQAKKITMFTRMVASPVYSGLYRTRREFASPGGPYGASGFACGTTTEVVSGIVSYIFDSYMTKSIVPMNLPYPVQSHYFYSGSKKTLGEITKFDIWGWTDVFSLVREYSNKNVNWSYSNKRWITSSKKYPAGIVSEQISLALILVIAMLNSLVSNGVNYTVGTKNCVLESSITHDYVQTLKDCIQQVTSCISRLQRGSSLRLDLKIDGPLIPPCKSTNNTEAKRAITRIREGRPPESRTASPGLWYLYDGFVTMGNTIVTGGVSWGEVVNLFLGRTGLYNALIAGIDIKPVLMAYLKDKFSVILASVTAEERDLVITKVAQMIKDSNLDPRWGELIQDVKTTFMTQPKE